MRSLVITALILIFNIVISVLGALCPYMSLNTATTVNLNQTIVKNMTDEGKIVSAQSDSQNAYYSGGINIINLLSNIVLGTIFVGYPLWKMGVNILVAGAIDAILSILVIMDLLLFWKGIHW